MSEAGGIKRKVEAVVDPKTGAATGYQVLLSSLWPLLSSLWPPLSPGLLSVSQSLYPHLHSLLPLRIPLTPSLPPIQLVAKRQNTDGTLTRINANMEGGALIMAPQSQEGPPRTSGLLAANMLLTGHKGHIHTVRFNHSGTMLASGSFDKTVLQPCY
jgi:WD40 repeat protein